MFSFPLRLFVCFHDFGCCLSSGGMYTCSYPTLVQLSGAFGGLPCFFFLSLHFKWCFLVFFFCLFIDSSKLQLVSSVCHRLSGLSPLLFISVGWLLGAFFSQEVTALWPLYRTALLFFLPCALKHSLCDLQFLFWKLHYTSFPFNNHSKGLVVLLTHQFSIGFSLLCVCMERKYCTFSSAKFCFHAGNGSDW